MKDSIKNTMSDYYFFCCVRDGQDSVYDSLQSVINQTIPPKKIIVVDDGSTDNTSQILEKIKKHSKITLDIITLDSKTRDYSRIPTMWNMCLDKNYKYHWIGADDNVYPVNYAETILNEFHSDPGLVICSGDVKPYKAKSPLGGGRFVDQEFFFSFYNEYPNILGYESEILYRSMCMKHKIKVLNDLRFIHTRKLGGLHNFRGFGRGMKTLGYHPVYAILRCMFDFFYNKSIGKKGSLSMFYHYITFKPEKTGFYSKFPLETRTMVRQHQSHQMIKKIKKVFNLS